MHFTTLSVLLAADVALAYPWVAEMPGVDSSLLKDARVKRAQTSSDSACPNNPNHPGAAPYSSKYPYVGAKNGLPGTGKGGIPVPAPGDTAHAFEAPGSQDIRGPCPGLNTAANHHFLSHDGITTFNELVDAQQNLYNVGYDLALLLATLGVGLDGDIMSGKLSLGCGATSRTASLGGALLGGDEPGLDGHNKFEGDTSLTRNDFYLANGDDYSFNGTLFGMMQDTCQGNFNRDNLAKYRKQRYDQSKADNSNFYYGPKSLLLYGAASFLYELFANKGPDGNPDLATISSFFGAEKQSDGSFTFNGQEKIPDNWSNRVSPYSIMDVSNEINAQYLMYPVLFGGNTAQGQFDALPSFESIKDGNLTAPDASSTACLLYQLATENVPTSLSGVLELPLEIVSYAAGKLNPVFKQFGCPLKTT